MIFDIPGNVPKQFPRTVQKPSERGNNIILFSLSPGDLKSESGMKGHEISWSACVTDHRYKKTKLKTSYLAYGKTLSGFNSQAWIGSKRILETPLNEMQGRGE